MEVKRVKYRWRRSDSVSEDNKLSNDENYDLLIKKNRNGS